VADDGLLDAIDRACAEVDRETNRRIKAAEAWKKSQLAKYERARGALKEEDDAADGPKPGSARTRSGGHGRRRRRPPATPSELAKRRDEVARLAEESVEPVSRGDVMQALALTENMAETAIQGLKKEGRMTTVGTGAATRYAPTDRGSSPLAKQAPSQGSPNERIIAVLEARSHATEEELGQALNEPATAVRAACGKLLSEETIEMRRFDRRQVYVIARNA
jgi:hypothetical protein